MMAKYPAPSPGQCNDVATALPPADQRPGYQIGYVNREAVRAWFLAHVGGANIECSEDLGLSRIAVGRHIKTLRKEWL